MNTVYQLKNPCHPGRYLRRKIFEPRNLTIMGAAGLLGVTRQSLSNLLNEKAALTADTAFQIEAAFGCSMEMLMEMQKQFDIAAIRRRERSVRNAAFAQAWSKVAVSRLQAARKRSKDPSQKQMGG